ncbi:AAC(3) family N-acetyltransferase [Kineococcus sp. SYSU DK005]|uniref:AAC(3) family N-acetyltransferase n=1 Tax=Kineococcus sp. SYSU DK005 TaxID=3383126 RepID=UPI003D7D00F0
MCLHSSLRSHGPVLGGAGALVDAFTDAGATLLVPTFSYRRYALSAPGDLRPARNGVDYTGWDEQGGRPLDPDARDGGQTPCFTPSSNETDTGAVPAEVLTRPGRRRGNHPLCSFTALGAGAQELVAQQTPVDVFAPLAALAEHEGLVVLAGVGLTRMTLLHHAEVLAGRVPLRRWAAVEEQVEMVVVGGCSEGFEQLGPHLAHLQARRAVGQSVWRVYPAEAVLEVARRVIGEDPAATVCAARCLPCLDAVRGGPLLG